MVDITYLHDELVEFHIRARTFPEERYSIIEAIYLHTISILFIT
jgi:hypothetical protein